MRFAARSLLAFILASPAAAGAQERQDIENVWVLTEGRPMAERQVARRRPFYQQTLFIESDGGGSRERPAGIRFGLSAQELDALRDRHEMDDHAPWVLLEWHARTLGGDAPARHLGFLHCTFRLVTFVGQVSACLRDGDRDGRLDGAATIRGPIPPEGLRFAPIAPVPYRYFPRDRGWSRYPGENRFALAYDLDEANGRLVFSIELLGPGLPADFKPSVVVDPARLPATVELGGAQLTLLAWDGRRATVRVDRPFPSRPVRLIRDQRGTQRGWRFDYIEEPLPGMAPAG